MSGVVDHVNLNVKVDSMLLSALDLSTVVDAVLKDYSLALSNGTGANQASNHWHDRRTTAGNDDLDLAGVLVNGVGTTITFTKIKAIIVKADSANGGDVIIGAAGANQFFPMFGANTHTIKVKPGGLFIITAPDATGLAVTAGTGDILRFAPSAGSVTYDVVFIGVD